MKNIGSLFYKPKKDGASVTAKRWNPFTILGKALRRTCTAIGAMVLFSIILSVIMVTMLSGKVAPPLPDDMVLVLNIDNGVTEIQTKPSLLEPFPFTQPTLRTVIDTLDKSKDDPRVRGLILSLKGGSISVAHTQELRGAIRRFKAGGKFTKIYAPSYVDGMGGLGQYYLASMFDEIWMQPVGMLSISGVNLEMPFAREALDKLGVSAQFFQREEFKSAMESFTNSEISAANKASLDSMIGNITRRMIIDIAADRDLERAALRRQIDQGILTGQEAVNAKLIDRLDYADVMISEIRKEATGDPDDETVELVSLTRYGQGKAQAAVTKKQNTIKTKTDIALIYAVGTIVDQAGAGGSAGATQIAATIREAYEDDNIKAIVLRVDSPGGSPSASETIRRALVKAQEKGKKVIISMGPVAASGGYWISADADMIFALPGTLTGSIGVVMGKFEASKLWENLGINWDGTQFGENADIWSINKKFDASATARMNVLIDDVYNAFVTRVSEGRGLTKDQVKQVAKGRAWTGEQAKANGLVDEVGGLNDALDKTATLFNGVDRSDLNIIQMPRQLSKVEQILELFGQQVSLGYFFKNNAQFFERMGSVFAEVENVKHAPQNSVYNAELEALR